MESLLHYVEAGVKEGAKLIYGGKRVDRKGTVISKAKILHQFYDIHSQFPNSSSTFPGDLCLHY